MSGLRRGIFLLPPIMLAAGAICAVLALRGSEAVEPAARQAGHDILATAPRIAGAIVLAAFIQVWIPKDGLAAWFGRESGVKGLAAAGALGSLTVGGPMTSFPLIAALRAAGAEIGCVVAFLTGWSLLGLQRVLIWELPLLGVDFVILKLLSCLLLPLLAGILMRLLAPAMP